MTGKKHAPWPLKTAFYQAFPTFGGAGFDLGGQIRPLPCGGTPL